MKLPGEVSFMPLNRLEVGRLRFPDTTQVRVIVRKYLLNA